MIQFFGTELPVKIPADTDVQASIASIMCVSDERVKKLVTSIIDSKKAASDLPVPGMPSYVRHFSLIRFFELLDVDADSPNELVLIGMTIGRMYANTEAESDSALKRLTKMMDLMATNPAKAHKKIMKSIKKKTKSDGN